MREQARFCDGSSSPPGGAATCRGAGRLHAAAPAPQCSHQTGREDEKAPRLLRESSLRVRGQARESLARVKQKGPGFPSRDSVGSDLSSPPSGTGHLNAAASLSLQEGGLAEPVWPSG